MKFAFLILGDFDSCQDRALIHNGDAQIIGVSSLEDACLWAKELCRQFNLVSLQDPEEGARLLLLGPHDPYLDLRDRDLILPGKARQRQVWKTVGNPGAVLLGGRVIGFWTVRTMGDKLDVSVTLFEPLSPAQRARLEELAQGYAAFRESVLRKYTVS